MDTAEYPSLNGMFMSHPFSQSAEFNGEDGGSQRLWMAARKQHLPNTRRQLHIRTHSNYDSRQKICERPSQTKSQHGRGRWHVVSPTPSW